MVLPLLIAKVVQQVLLVNHIRSFVYAIGVSLALVAQTVVLVGCTLADDGRDIIKLGQAHFVVYLVVAA